MGDPLGGPLSWNSASPSGHHGLLGFLHKTNWPPLPWKAALPAKGGNLGTDNATGLHCMVHGRPWVPTPGAESGAGKTALGHLCSVDLGPRGLSWPALNSAQVSQGPTANRQDTKQGQLSFMEGPLAKARGEHRRSHRMVPWPQTWAPLPALGGRLRGRLVAQRQEGPWAAPDSGRRCLERWGAPVMQGECWVPVPDPASSLTPLPTGSPHLPTNRKPRGKETYWCGLLGAQEGRARTWIREVGRDPPHCGP